ncbi:hypothetical protein GCM10023093_02860 [Nemorincola caseinilytica]|uniref:Peptidase M56 domain-containing protein n=1 Tax=Nemorincola caseinilytica TaxID=2054315 RepID=A0ABP8N6Z9_9BACT
MSAISITSLAHSFSYALLYSLWQGLLIYGMLFVVLRALPGMGARTRYSLSFGALAALFIWFADTWESQYSKLQGVTVYITRTAANGAVTGLAQPLTANASTPARFDIFREYLPLVGQYVPIIMMVYSVGLLFMLLRFSINMRQLRSLTSTAASTPATEWTGFVNMWRHNFGISRPVRIMLSERVNVPMMLGALKPVILLPVATINHLTTEQVESIIMHELAHIKRHDYLFNLVQTVVETILFFNPFVWLMSSVIRREREHCCDDLVVSCAADPLHYARALALLEEDRMNNNSLSLAATGSRNQLFDRIKRIMEMKKENIAHRRYSLVVVAVAAALFIASMTTFTTTFAQKVETEKKAAPQKKTTTSKTVTVDGSGKKKVVTKTKTSSDITEDEDVHVGNVNVKVLVDDDDNKHGHARVVTVNDVGDCCEGKKKCKKIVMASGGRGANSIVLNLDDLGKELENVHVELENIDWDQIQAELKSAMAELKNELNMEDLGEDIRVEVKKAMADARRAQAEARREMADSRQMAAEARAEAAHARAMARNGRLHSDTNDIETMLNKMQKDGLIDRNEKFKIEKENNELYINGQKQSGKVYEKYSRYMEGKEVTIKGGKGSLNININN